MSATVYIAIYRPRDGNYYHWALYIEGTEGHLYEVVGEHPDFQYHHLKANPASSQHHTENILVGYVSQRDLSALHSMMPTMNIDNDTSGWTCQDWVLETLEALCGEFYLDADDDDYKAGIKRAKKKYFGPI